MSGSGPSYNPYALLPFRTEYFYIDSNITDEVVKTGFYIDYSRIPVPVYAHIYSYDHPDNWCMFSVNHNNENILSVMGYKNDTSIYGLGLTILFTQKANYTLKSWLSSHSDQLILIASDLGQIRPSEPFVSFSALPRKLLRGVLSGIIYMWVANFNHGYVSAENIYVFGETDYEIAKLGQMRSIDLGNVDENEEVRKNLDITAFCNMICTFPYPQDTENPGRLIYPSELFYFLRILDEVPNVPSAEWKQYNILNLPNHPLWMDCIGEKRIFWHESFNKVNQFRTVRPKQYQKLENMMKQRLSHYSIDGIDWITNVIQSNHDPSFTCRMYNPDPTEKRQVMIYKLNNPFSILKFARHVGEHPFDVGDQEWDRHLWSFYPGYMCVLHEVLSGFRIFPKDPPYGGCTSRV